VREFCESVVVALFLWGVTTPMTMNKVTALPVNTRLAQTQMKNPTGFAKFVLKGQEVKKSRNSGGVYTPP